MTDHELKFLFKKYLNRNFQLREWYLHGKKSRYDFEIELSRCDEYLQLKKLNDSIGDDETLKIAILLIGHVRKNSMLAGINNFCKNYNYDIFIHTWDNIGMKGNETVLNDAVSHSSVLNEIDKYKNVKNYQIENNKDWINSQKIEKNYFNLSSPEIFIKSQLYSISRGYKLMEEYSEKNNLRYDIVFKFRFDSEMIDFNLSDKTIIDAANNDIIFTPNSDCEHQHIDNGTSCWACDNMYYLHDRKIVHIFEHTNVICDMFAYGSQNSMKKYCDLYNSYDKLNKSLLAENLKYYKKINKNVKYENGNYMVDIAHEGHVDSLYYYYCSYPERLLQLFLKDYMLLQSRDVKLKLIR